MAGKATVGVSPQAAARLRSWRAKHGMSQLALARALGLQDQASVGQWETGRWPITYKRLVQLSGLTGIPIWDLATPEQRRVIRALAAADPSPRRSPDEATP